MHILKTPEKQQGISLLELTFGLTILAAILISSLRYFQVARESGRINETILMIKTVSGAAEIWRGRGLTFLDRSVSNEVLENDTLLTRLFQMGLLPHSYVENNKSSNPWGGEFKVDTISHSNLKITFSKVPKTACENIKTKLVNALPIKKFECVNMNLVLDLVFD